MGITGLEEALQVLVELTDSVSCCPNEWEQGFDAGVARCRAALSRRIDYLKRRTAAEAAGETRYRVLSFVQPWPGRPKGVHVLQYVVNDELLSTDVCVTPRDIGTARCRRELRLANRDLFEDVDGCIKMTAAGKN